MRIQSEIGLPTSRRKACVKIDADIEVFCDVMRYVRAPIVRMLRLKSVMYIELGQWR